MVGSVSFEAAVIHALKSRREANHLMLAMCEEM